MLLIREVYTSRTASTINYHFSMFCVILRQFTGSIGQCVLTSVDSAFSCSLQYKSFQKYLHHAMPPQSIFYIIFAIQLPSQ